MEYLMTDEQVARLDAALTRAREHPEQHDQATWFRILSKFNRNRTNLKVIDPKEAPCGSAGCIAGWVVYNEGCLLVFKPGENQAEHVICDPAKAATITDAEEAQHIRDVAADLLGLNYEDSDYLFEPDNTIRTLHFLAYVLSDGRIPVPESIGTEEELADWMMWREHYEPLTDYARRHDMDHPQPLTTAGRS